MTPCFNCDETDCHIVCWRDKCLEEWAKRYTRMPSGDYLRTLEAKQTEEEKTNE